MSAIDEFCRSLEWPDELDITWFDRAGFVVLDDVRSTSWGSR